MQTLALHAALRLLSAPLANPSVSETAPNCPCSPNSRTHQAFIFLLLACRVIGNRVYRIRFIRFLGPLAVCVTSIALMNIFKWCAAGLSALA